MASGFDDALPTETRDGDGTVAAAHLDMTPGPPQPPPTPPGGTDFDTSLPVLETSYKRVPTKDDSGEVWGRVGQAASHAFEAAPSLGNEPGNMSPISTAYQERMNTAPGPFGWVNRNIVNPAIKYGVGYPLAGLAAGGAAVGQTAHEVLDAAKVPGNLQRDLPFLAAAAGTVAGSPSEVPVPPVVRANAADTREVLQGSGQMARAPSLVDLNTAARRAPASDPVTAAAIDTLRTATAPTAMPQPPIPFKPVATAPPAPPTPLPGGGLLGVQSGATSIIPTDEMLARSQYGYGLIDKAAAQGANINGSAADALLKPLTDAVTTDPHKAIAEGNTSLVQLGKEYQALQGQPMTFDAALTLDKRLTEEKYQAYKDGKATLGGKIGDAQDAFRAKLENLGDADTTGDASALAALPDARKGFQQYRKQAQLDDIDYNASLAKTPEAQEASRRSQLVSMLKNDNKMAGWSDDERAALETQVKSGQIGSLTNLGLGLFKPAGKVVGGLLGSPLGVGGTVVGGEIGGELGALGAARLRARLSQLQTDPVRQALSANMPPPPAGWQPRAQ